MKTPRITIWGNSGSGKSTLAELLGATLSVPVYHVDRIAWRAGWRFTDETVFLAEHQLWLDQPTWIIEGVGHLSGVKQRFARADVILFLDTPAEVCRARAQQRIDADKVEPNRFIAAGCRYAEVVERQWQVIDHFARHVEADIREVLARDFSRARTLRLDGTHSAENLRNQVVSFLENPSSADGI